MVVSLPLLVLILAGGCCSLSSDQKFLDFQIPTTVYRLSWDELVVGWIHHCWRRCQVLCQWGNRICGIQVWDFWYSALMSIDVEWGFQWVTCFGIFVGVVSHCSSSCAVRGRSMASTNLPIWSHPLMVSYQQPTWIRVSFEVDSWCLVVDGSELDWISGSLVYVFLD